MADVLFGKNEFNAALAMLSHEGANGIVKLLNQGKQEEAFKYTAGLIDTWTNRASGTNGNVIDQMSKPFQITDWDRNQSVIDKKALGLDTRIRDMAAAYVQGRLGGNDAIHPKANFYLNKDLVDAFHLENPQKYTQSYRSWYDGANDVVSYGDKGRGGKNSTETQFVSTTKDRKVADSYKLVSRGDLSLKPTDSAQNLYFLSSGDPKFSVDPGARINAPLGHIDVSQGLGDANSPELANYTFGLDGPQSTARYFAPDTDVVPDRPTGTGIIVGALNDFSDGITEGLEGAGRAVGDVAGQIGDALGGLFTGGQSPAPGPLDFANGSTAGGTSSNGDLGTGITPTGPGPAPGPYDFANGSTTGTVPNGSFGDGITPNGPTEVPTVGPGPNAPSVPYNGFDAQAYLAANQDVVNSATYGSNPLQHFLDYGYAEGRTLDPQGHQIAQGVDLNQYLAQNIDVAQSGQNPLEHFLRYGAAEGRTLGPGALTGTIGAPFPTPTIGGGAFTNLLGPTPGQTVTASPGIGNFDFSSAYLAQNKDVAAAGMSPWEHFLRYGAQEGRALNTAGDRFDPNAYLAQNADVQQAGQDALAHYLSFGAAEGRAAPLIGADGTVHNVASLGVTPTLSASLAPYLHPQGIAPNVPAPFGQTIGPSSGQSVTASPGIGDYDFSSAYLAANADVAQAGMGAWEHFLRFGAKENRAINAAGDHFDPNAYLSENVDVRDAGQDALTHFLTWGAAEGRDAPIIGADGVTRDIGNLGVTPTITASLMPFLQPQSAAPLIGPPDAVQAWSPGTVSPFGFGGNVSQGVGNGSFGAGITPNQQVSPYGFSGLNPSGFLGATAQSLGGSYAVGSAADLGFGGTGGGGGSGGDGTIDPFGFGGDVSGFDVNNLGGSATQESPVASGYGDGVAIQGRNNQASQNAFIAGEWKKAADSTAAARLLGEQITNVAPGNQTNYALGAINPGQTASIQQTPFTPVNMSGVFAPMPTAMFMPRFGGW